jgi:tetratricopeptide (TPR) repeat protein
VSYEKVGDVQVAQGNLAGALKSYRDSLAITERLAQSDPGNAGWQRDVSVSYSKLASAYRKGGESAKALDALREGRVIMERLTKLSSDNAQWKRDLAWFRQTDCRAGEVTGCAYLFDTRRKKHLVPMLIGRAV